MLQSDNWSVVEEPATDEELAAAFEARARRGQVMDKQRAMEVLREMCDGREPTKSDAMSVLKVLADEDADMREYDAEHLVASLKAERDAARLAAGVAK